MTSFRLICLACLTTVFSQLTAADYYVSPTGSDIPSAGTFTTPWATLQYAADRITAGDTLWVRGGTYTAVLSMSNRAGTAQAPITLRNYPGEFPILNGGSLTVPTGGISALLTLANCSHITIQGLDFYNYKTTSSTRIPAGIYVHGSGTGVKLQGNTVREIWQSSTGAGDGFGIAVYGTSTTALDSLILDGNTVHSLRTGSSESVVLNGNVTNFQVTNNTVRDCNNIGIDFIGYEQSALSDTYDYARNGICRGNTIYNIDTQYNPAYGGNFTGTFASQSARNDTRAAPGLYVDGGANIVIERNLVYSCNAGASIGSEWPGKFSTGITFRNNVLANNHIAGLFLGGATSTSDGGTTTTSIQNNTFYRCDLEMYGGGSVAIQHNVSSTTVQQNIFVAVADAFGWGQFILKTSNTGSFSSNAINWNLYTGTSTTSNLEFIWNGTARSSFSTWKTASSQDANSTFTTSSMGFTNAASLNFTLSPSSPAVNAGSTTFTSATGEKDYAGQSRIASGRVDIGADEYLTPWQAWRDSYFSLPDGGGDADQTDDPDNDGRANAVEYALGSSPLASQPATLPSATITAGVLRFSYRKDGSDLSYTVQTSSNLVNWTTSATIEQTDGSGLYWRDLPHSGQDLFARLLVVAP